MLWPTWSLAINLYVLHISDSSNFMNAAKFERFILVHTNNVMSMQLHPLYETSTHVVDPIVEDEGQGPPKAWGPYVWYGILH